jgi:hypothetical protein
MNLKDQIELDIIGFFKQIETQNSNDKKESLRLLLNKLIHLSTAEFVMDKLDLEIITNGAKQLMATKTFPVYLGKAKNRVYEDDQVRICLIESVISYFNKNDCLKKIPVFDYRENKI